MSERSKARMDEVGKRGIGAGDPRNQAMSMGLGPDEADRAAKEARGVVDEEKKAEQDTPIEPPDTASPDDLDPRLIAKEASEAKALAGLLGIARDAEATLLKDPLMTDPRIRKSIEEGLEPIDVGAMLFQGHAEQVVTLFEGKVQLVLRAVRGDIQLMVDRWLYTLSQNAFSPQVRDKIRQLVITALTIWRIDGQSPGDIDMPASVNFLSGDIKEWSGIFEKKINWLVENDTSVIDLLTMNVMWFTQRVRRVTANANYVSQQIKKS